MNRRWRAGRVTAVVLLALATAACVSLLPKQAPVQLYRFSVAAPAAPPASNARAVRLAGVSLPPASGGNNILTVRGDEAAYIKDARWVSSASSLFEAAALDAFAAKSGPTRLLAQGEPGPAAYDLRLEVRTFEVRYGSAGSPGVAVAVYATLARASGDPSETAKLFQATAAASEDRLGPIIEAYDQATAQVLDQIVTWVNQHASA